MQIAKILKKDIQSIYGVISLFSIPFIAYLIIGITNLFSPSFTGGEVIILIDEFFSPNPNSIFIFSSIIMLSVLGFGAMVFVPPDVLSLVSSETKSFGLSIKQIPLRRMYNVSSKGKLLFTIRFDPINFKSREWAIFELRSEITDIPTDLLKKESERVGLKFDDQSRQLQSQCDVEELPWRILQFSRVLIN